MCFGECYDVYNQIYRIVELSGIRPSPVSCCWQCKYYDVKKLYCKDLDKKVSPFSLCPEIIDIEAEELRERKGVLHDIMLKWR